MGEIRTSATDAGGGHGAGTPIAMAPEQLRGEEPQAVSDIYGLGVLLYHLVSGRYPIEADSRAELLQKHLHGDRIPLRDRRADLPMEFVAVVERALAPDAKQRYSSAGEMERALAATIGAVPIIPGVSIWRQVLVAASLGGVLLLLTGVAVWLQRPTIFGSMWRSGRTSTVAPPRLPEGAGVQPQASLAVTAGLFRRADSKDQPLSASGGRIFPGDRLSMTIRGK